MSDIMEKCLTIFNYDKIYKINTIFNEKYVPVIKLYTKMTFWYFRFWLWTTIWIPFGFVLTILTVAHGDDKKYYNCIGWALRKWVTEGGYIAFRWCNCSTYDWIKWPHFLWLSEKDGRRTLQQYTTDDPLARRLPKLWFNGTVRRGDVCKKYITND